VRISVLCVSIGSVCDSPHSNSEVRVRHNIDAREREREAMPTLLLPAAHDCTPCARFAWARPSRHQLASKRLTPPAARRSGSRLSRASMGVWSVEAAYELVELVELLNAMEDRLLRCLLHLTGEEELVEDHIDLVEVEDEVELAHIAKELIKELHEEVDGLKV